MLLCDISWYGRAMPQPLNRTASPVSPDDVRLAVRLAVAALSGASDADWDALASGTEWDCWETVEHLSDGLFAYAAQLGPEKPPQDGFVPFAWSRTKPGGPPIALRADRAAGTAGLLQVFESCGVVLAAMVQTAPAQVRAFHGFGVSDPEGFAAMAVVEVLAHTHDIAGTLGVAWEPPAELCDRALVRLFPHAPEGTPRWQTLLWATGRAELPGHPRLGEDWRWFSAPR